MSDKTKIELKAQVKSLDMRNGYVVLQMYDDIGKVKQNEFVGLKVNRAKRSLSQNNLYWLFCGFVAKSLRAEGNMIKPEQVHDYFKQTILSKPAVTPSGENIMITGTTTNLPKGEFGQYFEQAMNIAIEWGVPVEVFQAEYEEHLKSIGKI